MWGQLSISGDGQLVAHRERKGIRMASLYRSILWEVYGAKLWGFEQFLGTLHPQKVKSLQHEIVLTSYKIIASHQKLES